MQRGIAVAGVNAYEDSDLYVAQPEALEDLETGAAAGDDNSTASGAAPPAQPVRTSCGRQNPAQRVQLAS